MLRHPMRMSWPRMLASSMALAPGDIDPNPTGLEDSRTMPRLPRFDNDSKIGDVSNEQLRFLIDHLANDEDTEFYVDCTIVRCRHVLRPRETYE